MISWPAAKQMRCVKPSMATRVAVAHELGDRVAHGGDLREVMTRAYGGRSVSGWPAGRLDVRVRRLDVGARPRRRCARPSSISSSLTIRGGDMRTAPSPASSTSRPRWKQAHLDGVGRLGRVELDADHEAHAADVADQSPGSAPGAAQARPAPARRARAALAISPSSSSSDRLERARRRRPGCRRRSSRGRRRPRS